MSPKASEILSEALKLSEEDRAELSDAIYEDLYGEDPAWAAEIKRRVEEIETGTVQTVPWEQVDKMVFGDVDESENP